MNLEKKNAILDMYGKVCDICSSVYGVVNQSVCYTDVSLMFLRAAEKQTCLYFLI